MRNDDPIVRVRGLRHRYGSVSVLENIDLAIAGGRTIGFIGPDGAGKSTLLGLIAGARRLQHGDLRVLGGDMAAARHRRQVCPRIAYMPQGLGGNLYGDLSVAENITFFARLFGVPGASAQTRMQRLLAATDLTPFAQRRARNLSGGMKQKLGLCCALVHDPDLLILDEPTTGIDPLSRRNFWELIDGIRRESARMTVLVATGYMHEAEQFDSIVMLDQGRILAAGAPADLKQQAGSSSLEEAFAALQPAGTRRASGPLTRPPRAPESGAIAIAADGLTRRFNNFVAVDRVSFRIERGEIFGFLGPNGCGKTTTMKMLTALLPPSEGHARLFGEPVEAGSIAVRRRLGYMSQSFSLYTELTVGENLALHARLYDLPAALQAARAHQLADRFDLTHVLDQRADRLPLGIRQRLALAVAVIHAPELLILDEPTSGVDPAARDDFWRLIFDLSRRQGVTIFVSTHYMNEAERCDRVAFMNGGRLLATAAPEELVRLRQAANLEDAFIGYIRDDIARREAERGQQVAA